jgi:hypothetical protein
VEERGEQGYVGWEGHRFPGRPRRHTGKHLRVDKALGAYQVLTLSQWPETTSASSAYTRSTPDPHQTRSFEAGTSRD